MRQCHPCIQIRIYKNDLPCIRGGGTQQEIASLRSGPNMRLESYRKCSAGSDPPQKKGGKTLQQNPSSSFPVGEGNEEKSVKGLDLELSQLVPPRSSSHHH